MSDLITNSEEYVSINNKRVRERTIMKKRSMIMTMMTRNNKVEKKSSFPLEALEWRRRHKLASSY